MVSELSSQIYTSLLQTAILLLSTQINCNDSLPSIFHHGVPPSNHSFIDLILWATKCPSVPTNSTQPGTNTVTTLWFHQDQLLLNAILASISDSISPLIATAKTSVEVWLRLTQLYANWSCTRVMQLKESLTLLQKGDRSISNYMQVVRTTVDELAMIDTHQMMTLHSMFLMVLALTTRIS
jgi:hypothetical protein